MHIEVTTFRSESDYVDGRRPERVEFHSDIEADLARRDFTINALAEDPSTGEVVDPFGGRADLQAKLIRCVRDPLERFSEDGLRCLRAVRFATVLSFDLDAATQAAIAPTLTIFQKVAFERVRDELEKILTSPNAERGIQLLIQTGLLKAIFGFERVDATSVARAPAGLEFRLASLFRAAGVCAVERLKLSASQTQRVNDLFSKRVPSQTDDVAVRKWLSAFGVELASALAQLDAPELLPRLKTLAAAPLTTQDLALDGKEIMRVLGTGPGPQVGRASRFLLDQVLVQPQLNTPLALEQLLKNWVK
jgi:tRNA nucleotidyltransferase (CCA-adding enzyme)